jgi:hypothetical protein
VEECGLSLVLLSDCVFSSVSPGLVCFLSDVQFRLKFVKLIGGRKACLRCNAFRFPSLLFQVECKFNLG